MNAISRLGDQLTAAGYGDVYPLLCPAGLVEWKIVTRGRVDLCGMPAPKARGEKLPGLSQDEVNYRAWCELTSLLKLRGAKSQKKLKAVVQQVCEHNRTVHSQTARYWKAQTGEPRSINSFLFDDPSHFYLVSAAWKVMIGELCEDLATHKVANARQLWGLFFNLLNPNHTWPAIKEMYATILQLSTCPLHQIPLAEFSDQMSMLWCCWLDDLFAQLTRAYRATCLSTLIRCILALDGVLHWLSQIHLSLRTLCPESVVFVGAVHDLMNLLRHSKLPHDLCLISLLEDLSVLLKSEPLPLPPTMVSERRSYQSEFALRFLTCSGLSELVSLPFYTREMSLAKPPSPFTLQQASMIWLALRTTETFTNKVLQVSCPPEHLAQLDVALQAMPSSAVLVILRWTGEDDRVAERNTLDEAVLLHWQHEKSLQFLPRILVAVSLLFRSRPEILKALEICVHAFKDLSSAQAQHLSSTALPVPECKGAEPPPTAIPELAECKEAPQEEVSVWEQFSSY